jgi:hypothetical protein
MDVSHGPGMTSRCLSGVAFHSKLLSTYFTLSPFGTIRYWCRSCRRLVGVTGKP